MRRNIKLFIMLCGVGLLLAFSLLMFVYCRQTVGQPSNLEDAQNVFRKTSWYWSHCEWIPPIIPSFYPPDTNGSQIFMLGTNQTSPVRIIYTELKPARGLFSFSGAGVLQSKSGLQPPLFQLESGYTKNKPDTIIIVGIVKNRMFWVEADGENKGMVFTDACLVANTVLKQLGHVNTK
jgi:hypothetical protein